VKTYACTRRGSWLDTPNRIFAFTLGDGATRDLRQISTFRLSEWSGRIVRATVGWLRGSTNAEVDLA
jgi:hypothetical protein